MAIGLLLVGMIAVPAAATAKQGPGTLLAGFHGGLNGGSAVRVHNDTAYATSAAAVGQYNGFNGTVTTVDEGRIVTWVDGQERCSDLTIGAWLTLFIPNEDGHFLENAEVEMWLDGSPLTPEYSEVKPFLRRDGFVGRNLGVPVIGLLPVGTYNLVTDTYIYGDHWFHDDITFEVKDCE